MDLELEGKVAVVTGGGGAICGSIAAALADEGVHVVIWDISRKAAEQRSRDISSSGGTAIAQACDVTDRAGVQRAGRETIAACGTVDILINGAGGSRDETTTSAELDFFSIDPDDMQRVIGLNYLSAVIPSQFVGRIFADKGKGAILNISSIAGTRPLSRALTYSNAKAATNNFTAWLAVHMAQNYSPRIRVNAISPGFMLTEQNRFLLIDRMTGEYTERTQKAVRAKAAHPRLHRAQTGVSNERILQSHIAHRPCPSSLHL